MNIVILESVGGGKIKTTLYTCMSDAADDFGVDRSTVYKWAKGGHPKEKKGKRMYFDAEVVKTRNKKGGLIK